MTVIRRGDYHAYMRTFLKVIGYILCIVFVLDLVYILSGMALARHSLGDVIWHLLWAAAMVALGAWLISRKPKSQQ